MSSPLEKFIVENRDKFDTDEPDPAVWEKISKRMNPEAEDVKPMRSLPLKRWLAVAAAIVLAGLTGVLYYTLHTHIPAETTAGTNPKQAVQGNTQPSVNKPADTTTAVAQTNPIIPSKTNPDGQTQLSPDSKNDNPDLGDNKEMYYYAKLIELKHEELKALEKDEPLLYRQFAGDVQKLDSVYHTLKTQLPNNSNREQVIEAMISNLQLQIGLLNKQLEIIKQIKHSKKSAYEKAYKSV